MQSFQAPSNVKSITQETLAFKLRADLDGHTHKNNLTSFFTHFPPIVDGILIDDFVTHMGHFFLRRPHTDVDGVHGLFNIGALISEQHAAEYFNHIISLFDEYKTKQGMTNNVVQGSKVRGYWTAERSDKLLPIGPWQAKPDLIFAPVENGLQLPSSHLTWPSVLMVAEKTRTKGNTQILDSITATKGFLMLYSQGDRNWAPTIAFNSLDFFIHLFDCNGKVSFGPMSYKRHVKEFVTFILHLAYFAADLDGTMSRKKYNIPMSEEHLTFPLKFSNNQEREFKATFAMSESDVAAQAQAQLLALKAPKLTAGPPPIETHAAGGTNEIPAHFMSTFPSWDSLSDSNTYDTRPCAVSISIQPLPDMSITTSSFPRTSSKRKSAALEKDVPANQPLVNNRPLRYMITTPLDHQPREVSDAIVAVNFECHIATIQCEDKLYTIEEEIFRAQSLVGRATRVWKARDPDGRLVIIKESRIFKSRVVVEAEFIQHCQATQIPTIRAHQEFQQGTSTIRRPIVSGKNLLYSQPERAKRRVVETPFCVPLQQVYDPLELLGLFLDYTLAILYLKNNNRMHRDISPANLMISGLDDSHMTRKTNWRYDVDSLNEDEGFDLIGVMHRLVEHRCRRGILIDYDYASFIDPSQQDPLLPTQLQTHNNPPPQDKDSRAQT
ncbi:hypothetical protein C0991_004381, partial [Blastosporella zonata]